MRVIAGSAGGLRLAAPKRGVRPTMDRVKAAIFSSLGDTVIGARVLDLFAGSGALGIEALSRGAASVLFVEGDRQSIAAIKENLAKVNLTGRIRQENVFDFLRRSAGMENSNEVLPQLLDSDGVFVLEKRPSELIPATNLWDVVRARKYGATEVLFLSAIRGPKSQIR